MSFYKETIEKLLQAYIEDDACKIEQIGLSLQQNARIEASTEYEINLAKRLLRFLKSEKSKTKSGC